MLSIKYPSLFPHLMRLDYGLLPIYLPDKGQHILVIKATKEGILTARLNNEFKIYLLGDETGPASHIGLITAFFDDHDEPLVIKSALFAADEFVSDLSAVLGQDGFDLFFFDEHNRELMGVHAHNEEADRFRTEISQATFSEFDRAELQNTVMRMNHRFAIRDETDDAKAFTIKLGERLYPDDIFIIDARDDVYCFNDANKFPAVTSLEREEAGPFQERDIAVMIGRVFNGRCIYLNPYRVDTGKELTDILVVTDRVIILIQAKDSPNTEAMLERSIRRKRDTIRSHIKKAANQLRGALNYARENKVVTIQTVGVPLVIPVAERQLVGLVVVREMFDDDYAACSSPVLEVVRSLELPAVLLDYSGLHIITQHSRFPSQLVNGLFDILDVALEHEEFPKLTWNGLP